MLIYEACPAILRKPFGPLGIGSFIFITRRVYDTYVFCDGCLPLYLVMRRMRQIKPNPLFYVMGAIPGGSQLLYRQNPTHASPMQLSGHTYEAG